MHAVGGADAGQMQQGGQLRQAQPEVPIFVLVQGFIECQAFGQKA